MFKKKRSRGGSAVGLRTKRALEDDEPDSRSTSNNTADNNQSAAVTSSQHSESAGPRAKRAATGMGVSASTAENKSNWKTNVGMGGNGHAFTSSRSAVNDNRAVELATATHDIDTATDRDARAIFEKQAAATAQAEASGAHVSSTDGVKLYTGAAGYRTWIKKREEGNYGGKATAAGPLRASAHIRSTAMIEYNLPICKDYRETGSCGWGDACQFLHDRTVYKSSAQIDAEYEAAQLAAKGDGLAIDSLAAAEHTKDSLPTTCPICEKEFNSPVVTVCGHYFCGSCALKRHAGGEVTCFVCDKPTAGIFNTASGLLKKAKK